MPAQQFLVFGRRLKGRYISGQKILVKGLKMSAQQHALQINHELYERLNKLAIKETTKRKTVVSWSRLAKEILLTHIEQIEKPQPLVPERKK